MNEELKASVMRMADEEFQDFLGWVTGKEKRRRANAPLVEAAKAAVVKELREEGVVEAPPQVEVTESTTPEDFPAWQNPGQNQTKMYLFGDRVSNRGRAWESREAGLNDREPGAENGRGKGWADVTDRLPSQAVAPEPTGEPAPEPTEEP